jgi:hypothetical protein
MALEYISLTLYCQLYVTSLDIYLSSLDSMRFYPHKKSAIIIAKRDIRRVMVLGQLAGSVEVCVGSNLD